MFTKDEFTKDIEEIFENGKRLLTYKNNLYGSDKISFNNFKKAGDIQGITKEEALWGMCVKHIVAYSDMVSDTYALNDKKVESLMDIMNYCAISISMIHESEKTKSVNNVDKYIL